MKPAAGGRIAGAVPAMVGNGDAAVMPVAGWSGRRRSRRRHALAPVAKILEYKVCAVRLERLDTSEGEFDGAGDP